MIRTLDARVLGAEAIVAAVERRTVDVDPAIHAAVDAIVADVRARGDAALLELTARFDGFAAASPAALALAPREFDEALAGLAPDVRAALAYAAERIERYHAAALPKSWRITDEHGSVLGQEIRPLDRVGVYVPGGRWGNYEQRVGGMDMPREGTTVGLSRDAGRDARSPTWVSGRRDFSLSSDWASRAMSRWRRFWAQPSYSWPC